MAVIAVVWALAIHTLTTPKPVAVRFRPDAVVWGDRVFANRAVFARWLAERGLSYQTWARKHPAGLRIMGGDVQAAPPAQTTAPHSATRHVAARAVPSSSWPSPSMLAAYFLIGLVIAGLAFAPAVTLAAPFLGYRGSQLLDSRVYVAAAAASAAIGLLAARVAA